MNEMQKIARYWMVHNITGAGFPHKMHPSRVAAELEAQRLAAANRGQFFTVLEVVVCFVSSAPPIVRVDVVTEPPSTP